MDDQERSEGGKGAFAGRDALATVAFLRAVLSESGQTHDTHALRSQNAEPKHQLPLPYVRAVDLQDMAESADAAAHCGGRKTFLPNGILQRDPRRLA